MKMLRFLADMDRITWDTTKTPKREEQPAAEPEAVPEATPEPNFQLSRKTTVLEYLACKKDPEQKRRRKYPGKQPVSASTSSSAVSEQPARTAAATSSRR